MASLYLAAPLFTEAERHWNAALAAELRTGLPAHELLVPQEFCAVHDTAASGPDYAAIFQSCHRHLERSRCVIAVLDGPDPDSGTCWEAGFAYARGVPVVGLRTDWRPAEDGAANCMLVRSCHAVLTDRSALLATLRELLASG